MPAFADGVLPAAATPVQREQAQARFARGKDLLGKKNYDGALAEFRASHEIVASPNTRLEIARCLRAMGKLVRRVRRARTHGGRGQGAGGPGQSLPARARFGHGGAGRDRAAARLRHADHPERDGRHDRLRVGGEEIRRAAWGEPAPVVAGTTQVVVTTPGHAPVTRALTVAAGDKAAVTIDALSGEALGGAQPPAEPPPAPAPSGPVAVADLGLRGRGRWRRPGLVTFAITGAMAHSTYDDLNNACHGGPCPPDKDGEISSGKTQQTVANVALGVGIAGVAAGATLFVLSLPKSAPASNAAIVVMPAGVGVRGSW